MLNKLLIVSDFNEFKKYFLNTSWLFLEKIIRTISALLVGTYVARYLGPNNFGILNYSISFVFIFTIFAHLNLEHILVRELSLSKYSRDELLGTAFGLRIMGSIFSLCLIFLTLHFLHQDPLSNLLIMTISFSLLFQPFNVIDSFYQSQVAARHVVLAQVTQVIITAIIKIILVIQQAPLLSFAIVILFENLILAMALVISFRKTNKNFFSNWSFNRELSLKLCKFAFPLIAGGIAVLLYMRVDQFMIKTMVGNVGLGNYTAALSLCESWYFIPMVISSSVFPAILDAKQKNNELYWARIQRLYRLMVKIGLLILVPTMIFGDHIMHLLFGTAYSGEIVLKIYIIGIVFSFLGVASGKWLLAENHLNIMFYRTLCGLIANVVLNFLLIPKFGILGAAYASVITQFIAAYLYDLFHQETRISFKMKTKALLFIN